MADISLQYGRDGSEHPKNNAENGLANLANTGQTNNIWPRYENRGWTESGRPHGLEQINRNQKAGDSWKDGLEQFDLY
jgi:hypothetical protein